MRLHCVLAAAVDCRHRVCDAGKLHPAHHPADRVARPVQEVLRGRFFGHACAAFAGFSSICLSLTLRITLHDHDCVNFSICRCRDLNRLDNAKGAKATDGALPARWLSISPIFKSFFGFTFQDAYSAAHQLNLRFSMLDRCGSYMLCSAAELRDGQVLLQREAGARQLRTGYRRLPGAKWARFRRKIWGRMAP